MYTFNKEHHTWQEKIMGETKLNLRHKRSHSRSYYDSDFNNEYISKIQAIKMKKFYSRHLPQYMGETQPLAPSLDTRGNGNFAPLSSTGFISTRPNKFDASTE